MQSLANSVAQMSLLRSDGNMNKINYDYITPIPFSDDEDLETQPKSLKPTRHSESMPSLNNRNKNKIYQKGRSSMSNLTQMVDITKRRQLYLERTLYRNKNVLKKAKKEMKKLKIRVYPLNAPNLSELENGYQNIEFAQHNLSKKHILEEVKKSQRQMALKSIDTGRAFGTMSKNKYVMAQQSANDFYSVPCIHSQRLTIMKSE